jgi:prepilin-type N-terminal cleavage/methylation domain-containing protein
MRKINKCRKQPFTLLEVIVAMAIFAIIMLMMLQFFSGAQKIWTDSERKNDLYGDARTAMDLMATMLQSTYYSAADVPFKTFQATTGGRATDFIYFPVKSPLRPSGVAATFFVSFQLRQTGNLEFAALYDNSDAAKYADAFRINPVVDYDAAKSAMLGFFASLPPSKWSTVVKNMTSLRFLPLNIDYAANDIAAVPIADYEKRPNLVRITFTMLSSADHRQWSEMCGSSASPAYDDSSKPAAKAFRLSRERTFTRIVYIGQYGDN